MFRMEGEMMAKLLSILNGQLNGNTSAQLGFTSKVIPTEVKLAIKLRKLAGRSKWDIAVCYRMKEKIVRRIFKKKVLLQDKTENCFFPDTPRHKEASWTVLCDLKRNGSQ